MYVIDVVLVINVVASALCNQIQCLLCSGNEEAGDVKRVDCFDQQFDAMRLKLMARKTDIGDKGFAQLVWIRSDGCYPG